MAGKLSKFEKRDHKLGFSFTNSETHKLSILNKLIQQPVRAAGQRVPTK